MKRSAYTVIELMITVAIITLLFILFKYNSSYLEELRFENACGKIMTDIGYLQNMAINYGGTSLPYIEFNDNGYTCYDGNGELLKDPLTRKVMDYQFLSREDEKNFKNVELMSVLAYSKNKSESVSKLEYNKYGGLSIFEDSSAAEPDYDNEDSDSNNDWEYLEIVLKNVSPNMNNLDKTIRVEPLTLNMSAD